MAGFELGLYSFVELMADPLTGVTLSPRQRFANWLEEVELAINSTKEYNPSSKPAMRAG